MILALLLATAQPSGPLPDPRTNYPAYAKYTDYQFQCDDRPYSKGCGNDRHQERLLARWRRAWQRFDYLDEQMAKAKVQTFDPLVAEICGPEGANDWTADGPTCDREGWNPRTHRYEGGRAK